MSKQLKKDKSLEERLSAPMEYKWRLQSIKGNRATMVAYVDSRQVQDRLDEVFGVLGWKDEYREIGGNLFCGISVYTPEGGWVTKWDVGTESNVEKEKGNSSDSFKRSAVKLGVGRFLYSLDIITLNTATHTNGRNYPATSAGKILWTPKQITEYCNELTEKGIVDDTRSNRSKTAPKPKSSAKVSSEFKSVDEVCARIAVLNPEEVVKDFIKKGGKATQVSAIIDGIKKKNDLKGAVKYYESIKHLI